MNPKRAQRRFAVDFENVVDVTKRNPAISRYVRTTSIYAASQCSFAGSELVTA